MDIDKKVKEAIEELDSLNKSFKEFENQYNINKAKLNNIIKKYMGAKNIDALDFVNKSHKICKIVFVQPKKIIFDAEKLEKRIDKKLCNLFIKKEYHINDIVGLLAYLKSIDADPKIIRSYINIEKKVDNKKIDELSELGQITSDDIKGCYEVKDISSYLKISEVEDEEGGTE